MVTAEFPCPMASAFYGTFPNGSNTPHEPLPKNREPLTTHSFGNSPGTCGMMITAEDKTKRCKNGNVHRYVYYHCTRKSKLVKCRELGVRAEVLAEQLSGILSCYAMPSPWAKEFMRCMEEDRKTAEVESSSIIEDLRRKVLALSEKVQRLLDVYLAQDIDRETYLSERVKLFSEKKTAEEKIAQLELHADAWLAPMRAWGGTASTLGTVAERNDLPPQ